MRTEPSHRPDRLAVDADGRVACPRRGSISAAECRGCPWLLGTLEAVVVEVLCAARIRGGELVAARGA